VAPRREAAALDDFGPFRGKLVMQDNLKRGCSEKLQGNSCAGWRKCFVAAFFVLIAAGVTSPASADLLVGLQAYYPFNGNANDESGNGNHGTPDGAGLVVDRHGDLTGAYDFDGLDDHIDVPNAASLNGMTEMTLSSWIKTTSDGVILAKGNSTAGGQWQYSQTVALGSGRVIAFYFAGAAHLSAVGSANVDDGEWHSVISTIKNNVEAKTYVDGVLVGTGTPSIFSWNLSDTTPLVIGGRNDGTQYFDGQIDDIRIYDRILSQNEINILAELFAPEPSTITLAVLCLLSLGMTRRRRRR